VSIALLKLIRRMVVENTLALIVEPSTVVRMAPWVPPGSWWIATTWQPKRNAPEGKFLAIVSMRSFLFKHRSSFLAKSRLANLISASLYLCHRKTTTRTRSGYIVTSFFYFLIHFYMEIIPCGRNCPTDMILFLRFSRSVVFFCHFLMKMY